MKVTKNQKETGLMNETQNFVRCVLYYDVQQSINWNQNEQIHDWYTLDGVDCNVTMPSKFVYIG